MQLLIIEDNVQLLASLKNRLREYFQVDTTTTGKVGLEKVLSKEYDIIVLDLDLPDKSGHEVCSDIRHHGIATPILILTASNEPDKKVNLLDSGANDYMTKPFHSAELRARLQALIRLASSQRTEKVSFGSLTIDLSCRAVLHNQQKVALQRKEFDVLEYLMRHRGQVLTREMISDHVSDIGKESWSNVVDVYIKRLRDKLERPFGQKLIKTVHGVGYTIDE